MTVVDDIISGHGGVVWHPGSVSREQRWRAAGQHGMTLWLTGLPAAGKSTLAYAVEGHLITLGRIAYVLDGDNLRHGLNRDLGFAPSARTENVRRTAEVAVLLADAGLVVLVSLVSPYAADRDQARAIHAAWELPFVEVHVATPLAECERRDPKNLYRRARAGEPIGLTGLDAPYEAPLHPDVVVGRRGESLPDSIERVLAAVASAGSPASAPRRGEGAEPAFTVPRR